MQDFMSDLEEIDFVLDNMKFLDAVAQPEPRQALWNCLTVIPPRLMK